MKKPIYLDYNATTPVDPEVLETMLPWFYEKFGNAGSGSHVYGIEAAAAVKNAREIIADFIGCAPDDIIFTSGATESINLALKGIAEANFDKRKKIVTTSIEHPAVLDTVEYLEKAGFETVYIEVDKNGLLNFDELEQELTDDTLLLSVMTANNETGVIQDVKRAGEMCKERGIAFHSDATQGVGKTALLHHSDLNIDYISFTAHKIYGPKGTGVLYVNKDAPFKISQQIHGGGHEKGYRSGTLNVPGIVGLGKAVDIMDKNRDKEPARIMKLRDKFYELLTGNLNDVVINGSIEHRTYNVLNLRFTGVNSNTLLMNAKEIAASTGSACSSASMKPSHVLKAMGLSDQESHESVRFSLGRFNTEEQIEKAASVITDAVKRLRG